MTPWRKLSYEKLSSLSINGAILDLGGSHDADYHKLIQGKHTFTTVNLDTANRCDIYADLEQPFPIKNDTYDAVVCMNILEHIFNYRQFLNEAHRVLHNGGTFVILVPFLIQVHPSPHDYFRFSGEALARILQEAGFRDVSVEPVGYGSISAGNQLQHNLQKFAIIRILNAFLSKWTDRLISLFDQKKFYGKERYPLGYFVVAKK